MPTLQHFAGFAVEHRDAGAGEDVAHLELLVGFVVVIAEHRDCRHAQRRQLLRENARFVGKAVIGQVAGQQQEVGGLGDLREERLERAL